ncbi:uncharacterized protein K02A2.6-like [Nematostella vectensis]|uniref:uncharacterized protein K02A2.6-like n=1 Tax=Nematostella vectensis TaxID=45351 RepID=UPI00207785FE|nr:uncharacterized protein K02A2.6-like [Nematostella vectensis]
MKHMKPMGPLKLEGNIAKKLAKVESEMEPLRKDLRSKAKTCEFGTLQDSIVCGIDSDSIRERLLRNTELTLDTAINAVRAAETSKTQIENLKDGASLETAALNKRGTARRNQKQHNQRDPKREDRKTCGRCDSSHKPKECKAFGKECFKCNGKNHFSSMCKSKEVPPKKVHDLEKDSVSESDDSIDELFLGEIDSTKSDEEIYNSLPQKPRLQDANIRLNAYGGMKIPLLGKCSLAVRRDGNELTAEFYVVRANKAKPHIGLETCRILELIRIGRNVSEISKGDAEILNEFNVVFEGYGLVDGEYHINLSNVAQPTIHPPRKVTLSLMHKLKETLEKLTKMGVISNVEKATDWVSSLVIVEKKNGTLRLCLDPKELNNAIKREHYKPPTAETLSSKLSGKRVFTVIDMSNCYWHKKLDEESSYLCTFNTPFGRHKFDRMPFGISVAADVAQKMIDDNFSDIPGVLAVHDDIIIAGSDKAEHDEALSRVLLCARERNIRFNRDKIQLRVNQVKYLGNIVTADGFKPDPEKTKAIKEMPQPETKQDLQRLLGMVNYLSQYIPIMSEITAPLRSLLKRNAQWVWYDEHKQAVDKIKEALTNSPVLRYFDINEKNSYPM